MNVTGPLRNPTQTQSFGKPPLPPRDPVSTPIKTTSEQIFKQSEKISQSPSMSIAEKKVTSFKSRSQSETGSSTDLNVIPSPYSHSMDPKEISRFMDIFKETNEKSKADPSNYSLKTQFIKESLKMADAFHSMMAHPLVNDETIRNSFIVKEKGCVTQAQQHAKIVKTMDQFHAQSHYVDYLIKQYSGVNCINVNEALDLVNILQLSQKLDPSSREIKADLDKVVNFLKQRWEVLKREGNVDAGTYSQWTEQLTQQLNTDPLKTLFINHTDLFKLADAAKHPKYVAFFNKYPHLKSVESFAVHYKLSRTASLENKNLDPDNLKKTLDGAKSNLFIKQIMLASPYSVITPSEANMIRNTMLDKPELVVLFGNEDDCETLIESFSKIKDWIPGELFQDIADEKIKELFHELKVLNHVYIVCIHPNHPYKRKSPPSKPL